MPENKTQMSSRSVEDFLAAVDPERRREDAQTLDAMFRRVTGWSPRLWGPTIVGYGAYHYRYPTGREGDFLATGFSPRKARLVLYVLPGYADLGEKLSRLGKHKVGKSCLYINKLADVDLAVVEEIVRYGLEDLATRYEITPT